MFQLKMYRAVSGRAPGGSSPAPQPLPVQEGGVRLYLESLNERGPPPPCLLSGPEHRSVGWSQAAFLGREAEWGVLVPRLTRHPVLPPPCTLLKVEEDVEGTQSQFHFPGFCDDSCHLLSLPAGLLETNSSARLPSHP